MSLGGEILSLIVAVLQEVGVVAGVGAVTMTLVGHLLSLHAHTSEMVHGYVRAARHIRALALALIIISGGAAILIHFQSGTSEVLWAPAFIFKWLLIALLAAFYFVELKVVDLKRDAVEGFEGANWYALFIVHSMAPVIGWGKMLGIYIGWLVTFGIIWAGFVWLMRWHSALKPKPARGPNPFPPPPAKPAPAAAAAPKPAPAPVVPPPAKPAPAQKPIEIHPNHTLLPMVAELDLPAPAKIEMPSKPAPMPVPPPVAPKPAPAPAPITKVEIVPEFSAAPVKMSNLNESGLPALHVMPKRPEDIEGSKRGPVVKMSDE